MGAGPEYRWASVCLGVNPGHLPLLRGSRASPPVRAEGAGPEDRRVGAQEPPRARPWSLRGRHTSLGLGQLAMRGRGPSKQPHWLVASIKKGSRRDLVKSPVLAARPGLGRQA